MPSGDKKRLSKIVFTKKATKKHGTKYNYSRVAYTNLETKVPIICILHNHTFFQTPKQHLYGSLDGGCPRCCTETKRNNFSSGKDEFVRKATNIHGTKYDYTNVVYTNATTKVEISCKKHGPFMQRPNNHTSHKQGCPLCKSSGGENIIEYYLRRWNIPYIRQKRFDGCRNRLPLPFDFYIPAKNILIEFDGEQHFTPPRFIKNKTKAQNQLAKTRQNDKIKNQFCKDQNIDLLRIPYTELNNIRNLLESTLNILSC